MAAATFDYTTLKTNVADRLITLFGRACTLTKDPTTLDDPSRPWGADVDNTGTNGESHATVGVFLGLNKDVPLPQTTQEKRIRILFRDEATFPEEIGPEWYVIDGTRRWEILSVEPLEPGPVRMLYKVVAGI